MASSIWRVYENFNFCQRDANYYANEQKLSPRKDELTESSNTGGGAGLMLNSHLGNFWVFKCHPGAGVKWRQTE